MTLDKYLNPITTQDNIDELHRLLVQTCLNYIKEHNLTDIDEIDFVADGLSASLDKGVWTTCPDFSLTIFGLQEDSKKDKFIVRKIIGYSM